jgi:hypothetical protein
MHLCYFLSTNLDLIPPVLILNALLITLGPFAHCIPQKHLPLKEIMLMNPTNLREADDKFWTNPQVQSHGSSTHKSSHNLRQDKIQNENWKRITVEEEIDNTS